MTEEEFTINVDNSVYYPKYKSTLIFVDGFQIGLLRHPNRFHRFMHRIFFGFKYKKIVDE